MSSTTGGSNQRTDDPFTPIYITKDEVMILHNQNIARIVAIENSMNSLQTDIKEIVDWVRNARTGARVITNIYRLIGKFIVWIAVVYASVVAIRQGKFPDIHFPE